MRFASVGASNANSYASAAKAVVSDSEKVFRKQRETGPDYAGLSKVAMTAETAVKNSATSAIAQVAQDAIKATASAKFGALKAERDIKYGEQVNKTRMAGILPAVGKIVGSAFKKDPKRPPPQLMVEPVKPEKVERGGGDLAPLEVPTRRDQIPIPTPSASTGSDSVNSPTSTSSPSTGSRKELADAVAKYESGGYGYDAFNQGGTDGGTKVVGKSGAHAQYFGKPLTSMTVGQVLKRQSGYDDFSISDKQWRDNGGLHAVGRYQFIGPTLKDEVTRMGLPMDTMFDAQTQDDIFFSHAKRVGSISPWVGPSNNYNSSQKEYYNSIIRGL
jgi:hypothetical protein